MYVGARQVSPDVNGDCAGGHVIGNQQLFYYTESSLVYICPIGASFRFVSYEG